MRRDDRILLLTYLPALLMAAALLGVLVWRFWPEDRAVSGTELYREYFIPYPNVVAPINREVPAGERSLRERAYQAYESYDYGQADILLGKLPQSDTTRFYLGMIALIKEQPALARSLLKPVIEQSRGRLQEAAEWYSALLLLREGDLKEGRARMEDIASRPEHSYGERAKRLLADF